MTAESKYHLRELGAYLGKIGWKGEATMRSRVLIAAAALMLVAGPAFAFHCPLDMSKIDEALAANPQLSDEQMKEVEELRAAGEELHNGGQHYASVTVLGRAMEILGIE